MLPDSLSAIPSSPAEQFHSGQDRSRAAVWGPDYGDQVDCLRVFVKNLRKKMEPNHEHPQYITTEPWVGYRLKGSVESL
jgi:DNA-binding response OmpR family regulator